MKLPAALIRWLQEPVRPQVPAEPFEQPKPPDTPTLTVRVDPDAVVDDARLRAQLELHEGVRKRIYTDTVGKVSGGIGRNLTDKGFHPDEIELMYRNDVAEAAQELDRVLPWWRGLDEVRRRVLLDMMFNMGAPTLLGFKNTLAMIKDGRYREAAQGLMSSVWAQQTGARARRLSAMMGSGMDYTK